MNVSTNWNTIRAMSVFMKYKASNISHCSLDSGVSLAALTFLHIRRKPQILMFSKSYFGCSRCHRLRVSTGSISCDIFAKRKHSGK